MMHTVAWKDYRLSRMMLGTVQFGMDYGIANTTGKPAYRDVLDMVAAAVEGGVNCFDTAAAYGDSEKVLGKALRELDVLDRVLVVTKVQALPPECADDATAASRAIRTSIDASRSRLNLDCLPLVLFHREADARYLDVLETLKQEGRLRDFGVSGGNVPGLALELVSADRVAALQLPANILDRRHARSGIFDACRQHDVALFIRSVYLQGLLFIPEETIPDALREVIPVRRKLENLAKAAGMGLAELAVRYMLSQPGITSLLTGVDNLRQLRENLALFSRGPLPTDLGKAVDAAVPALPEELLTPSTWPNSWARR